MPIVKKCINDQKNRREIKDKRESKIETPKTIEEIVETSPNQDLKMSKESLMKNKMENSPKYDLPRSHTYKNMKSKRRKLVIRSSQNNLNQRSSHGDISKDSANEDL